METHARTFLSPGIFTHPTRSVWALVTEQSTYALGVTAEHLLVNLHWGGRLAALDDLPFPDLGTAHSSQDPLLTATREEYPAFGGLRYGELAARAIFADGVRDLDLRYDGFELDEGANPLPRLTVSLRDQYYPFRIALHYQVDSTNDLIIRSVTFYNEGQAPVLLERAFSAAWHIAPTYAPQTLITLAGQWAEETQIQRRPIVAGTTLSESRRGITSTNAMPWLAIEAGSAADLPSSDVYFGALAWSGNWMMRTTCDITGKITLVGGLSEHDFAWKLEGGSTFTTPDFVAGFASDGLNGARRRLHNYTRNVVLPTLQADQLRPVLYNSWEATGFDVHEAGQSALATHAARLGVELFVVDDGWFTGRVNDTAGLGDWSVDTQKFPNGLEALIEQVNTLGMNFGLWVEPEMTNPRSELYKAHPDWVYAFPTRARSEARNQLVLNLGRDDVRAYLLGALNTLLQRYPITYLKWDMNRPLSEPGWSAYLEQGGEVRELWVRHTLGVYRLLDALREQHPHLSIESCASGGGRADLGILRRTDQIWTSDNTHPEARLLIQEGFSLALPARVMGAWVTDAGRSQFPLAFRFHVSMLGALGIGGNLPAWSEEELTEATRWIAIYKEIRLLVQQGQQDWLLSPSATQGQFAAIQYTSQARDQALLFYFRRDQGFGKPHSALRLCHLKETALYRIEHLRALDTERGESLALRSGAALMHAGIVPTLDRAGAFVSALIRITEVDA